MSSLWAGLGLWATSHSASCPFLEVCVCIMLKTFNVINFCFLLVVLSPLNETAPTDWYVFNDYSHHILHTVVIYSLLDIFYLTAPSYSFFVSLWQILQWYCSADTMGIIRKHLPTLANLMKLWGERGRKTMWMFKTTLCLAHLPEQSVFVLNNLVHNSRKKKCNQQTQTIKPIFLKDIGLVIYWENGFCCGASHKEFYQAETLFISINIFFFPSGMIFSIAKMEAKISREQKWSSGDFCNCVLICENRKVKRKEKFPGI